MLKDFQKIHNILYWYNESLIIQMSSVDEKLNEILEKINLIQKHLKIVPDKFIEITNYESSITKYELFCNEELELEQTTINNHKSAIRGLLNYTDGKLNIEFVKNYLNQDNKSDSWKPKQYKLIKKYLRDYLELGNWINEFKMIKNNNMKIQNELPTEQELFDFYSNLHEEIKIVFLILYTSGLRIGEILNLKICDFNSNTNMINASSIHEGNTKHSWISYITQQTANELSDFMDNYDYNSNEAKIFSIPYKTIQQEFKDVSESLEIKINPHLLRKIFAEKCTIVGIKDKYIDAFCGRVPTSILSKNYSDYSPGAMKIQYEKVEESLRFTDLNYS